MRINRLASGVVARKGAHLLKVTTKAGVQTFKDKPPYDEPLDGVHHYFCDRKEGFILIKVEDGGEFTGKLIDEQTGTVMKGGESVLFSEDRRAYLASEHGDGLDGDVWTIYAVNGQVSWTGYNFISAPDQSYRYVDLGMPAWMPNGELVASATCASDENRKWKMKLVKNNGQWDWAPRKKCPASK
ncbi:hypothetical protein ASE26_24250 [Duganella sp. Root198D2]|nr:hypothetical protein ASD07_26900 [Duganella sp. Root336D2]KRB99082.1 hypothetical protein ASE26_24250 [Duganella sp. Root198D2]